MCDEQRVVVGDLVKHFKGNEYVILGMPTNTETGEVMVYYKSMSDTHEWVRPYDMFMGEVDREKYPDVQQKYRFEVIKHAR